MLFFNFFFSFRYATFSLLVMEKKGSMILHENIQTRLRSTPDGKIFDSELTAIFSLMVICLKLKDKEPQKSSFNFTKTYAFQFYVPEALLALRNLKLKVKQNKMVTSMEYSINAELGLALLKRFYRAKFIHAPSDRTRSELKVSLILQPTPKGTCVLQSFIEKIGMDMKNYPPILFSNFNSMYLLKFDRDPSNDKILYSKYLIYMVFITMMGDVPHVWSPAAIPEQIPSIRRKLKMGAWQEEAGLSDEDCTLDSTPSRTSNEYITQLKNQYQISHTNQAMGLQDERLITATSVTPGSDLPPDSELSKQFPFHHKYFSNPESDSHIQYYVSTCGVRVFENKKYYVDNSDGQVVIQYSFSGKAILQWLCDCTEIYNANQGIGIANLLLKMSLIESILAKDSASTFKTFIPDRNAYYKLSTLGEKVCHWDKLQSKDQERASSDFSVSSQEPISGGRTDNTTSTITLASTLKDPGLRMLFKEHLESEFCIENLQFYQLIREFHSRMISCKIILMKSKEPGNVALVPVLDKKLNHLESLTYQIYVNFLMEDAPHVINIDFELRKQAIDAMSEAEDAEMREDPMERRYYMLENKSKVLLGVRKSIYSLLEKDSLPKFLESKIFKEAMATLDPVSL